MERIQQIVAHKLNLVFILRIYVKLSALRLSVCLCFLKILKLDMRLFFLFIDTLFIVNAACLDIQKPNSIYLFHYMNHIFFISS